MFGSIDLPQNIKGFTKVTMVVKESRISHSPSPSTPVSNVQLKESEVNDLVRLNSPRHLNLLFFNVEIKVVGH